jgi:hypothetical protein
MEPSNEQYLIINALQTLDLIEYDWYQRDRGLWFITTLSIILPTSVIMQDGQIYPIAWVQEEYDNN